MYGNGSSSIFSSFRCAQLVSGARSNSTRWVSFNEIDSKLRQRLRCKHPMTAAVLSVAGN